MLRYNMHNIKALTSLQCGYSSSTLEVNKQDTVILFLGLQVGSVGTQFQS